MKYRLPFILVFFFSVAGLISSPDALGESEHRQLKYTVDGKEFEGVFYEAVGKASKHPGILIAPGWWGMTDFEKLKAEKLAEKGYSVLVADLYGGGKSSMNPDEANKYLEEANRDPKKLDAIFEKAFGVLKAQPKVDADRLAAIGFGFGGGLVIEQARRGLSGLREAINFYGGLKSPSEAEVKKVKAHILVLVGDYDNFVSKDQIDEFKKEMTDAKARFEVKVYKETFHEFARPGVDPIAKKSNLPFRYNANVEQKAWDAVYAALKKL